MHSSIHSDIARLRIEDMHRAARKARLAPSPPATGRARSRPAFAAGIRAVLRHA